MREWAAPKGGESLMEYRYAVDPQTKIAHGLWGFRATFPPKDDGPLCHAEGKCGHRFRCDLSDMSKQSPPDDLFLSLKADEPCKFCSGQMQTPVQAVRDYRARQRMQNLTWEHYMGAQDAAGATETPGG